MAKKQAEGIAAVNVDVNNQVRDLEKLMQHPMEYKRQTGRTTRMIQEAIAVASQGKTVVVLMKDEHQAKLWRSVAGGVQGIEIICMRLRMPEFDWKTLTFTAGPHIKKKLLIDHDVFEAYQRDMLKAWTQYDLPIDGTPYQNETLEQRCIKYGIRSPEDVREVMKAKDQDKTVQDHYRT